MGFMDKLNNMLKGNRGKLKEEIGKASNDDALRRQGDREQRVSDLKQAGEKAKDAFGND